MWAFTPFLAFVNDPNSNYCPILGTGTIPAHLCYCITGQNIQGKSGPGSLMATLYILDLKKNFLRFYFFICREGKRGEKQGEKHQCVTASCAPPNGDLAHNPGMCPDWESNRPPLGLQAGTQSTEPHQPGQYILYFLNIYVSIS